MLAAQALADPHARLVDQALGHMAWRGGHPRRTQRAGSLAQHANRRLPGIRILIGRLDILKQMIERFRKWLRVGSIETGQKRRDQRLTPITNLRSAGVARLDGYSI